MELRHLRYFVAVGEELNFRRAAERMHVAQPPLSAQIKNLEAELGVRLLDRNSHRVALTAAGEVYLDRARRILRDTEDATQAVRRAARGETGRLSIGFVASLGHGILPSVLRAYRQRYPEVELNLAEMESSAQVERLLRRQLDLAIIGLGLAKESADLEFETMAQEQLIVALPEEHPLARRSPKSVRLNLLAKERFFLGARQNAPVFNPWLVVLCQQAGFQPNVVQEADQPSTLLNYVAAGLGITILPAQFSRLATPGVCFIPLAKDVPKYRYCAAWRKDGRTPVLERFLKVAREVARASGRA